MIFPRVQQNRNGAVAGIASLEYDVLKQWEERIRSVGLCRDKQIFPRISSTRLQEKIAQQSTLIQVLSNEIKAIEETLQAAHFFIIVDTSGVILKLQGNDDILQRIDMLNIGPGTSVMVEHSGYNAIAVAMETGMIALVQGKEHTLNLFHSWNCICSPIRVKGTIQAYVNLTFPVEIDPTFAVPLLQHIARMTEKRLQTDGINTGHEIVYKTFETYQLTGRQKEVAYAWLQGYTYTQIAQSLYISIHTVRTILKTVYDKTGVNSKSAFIRKFT